MTLKLSDRFTHNRDIKMFVEDDYVLGYVVVDSRMGAKVWPLYRGEIHVYTKDRKGKRVLNVFSTYEQGSPLNDIHMADPQGARFALIAAHAIGALDERARFKAASARRAAPAARKKKRKTKP